MQYRTDLAMEADEQYGKELSAEDIERSEQTETGVHFLRMRIKSNRAAEAIGKPPGLYITAEVPPLSDNDQMIEEIGDKIGEELARLLPEKGTVLVVGLGNRAITPDALGPEVAGMVLATRHIQGEFARSTGLDGLRPTAVIVPNVLGKTGVETEEIVRGLCHVVKPSAVIAIDALASMSVARLGCTVQLCDTGISPGSGVGNHRQSLDRDSLGVPVIAVGVPTVVDARIIAVELTGQDQAADSVTPRGENMMVTPREIDLIIQRASRLVALAINHALQPDYSAADLVSVAI